MKDDQNGKRHRSPNYPSISLPDALDKIQLIYDREGNHAADTDTLAKALGYSGKNGASDSVLSALKKYELLVKVSNTQYKLSDESIDILNPPSQRERVNAIKKAAFAPSLFSEIYDECGLDLPSENNLRNRLLKRGFSSKALDDVVRSVTSTWEFVNRECRVDGTQQMPAQKDEPEEQTNNVVLNSPVEQPPTSGTIIKESNQLPGEVLKFKISRDSFVQIAFDGMVTQEAIDKLIQHLELSKDTYPAISELQNQEKQAIWKNNEHDQPVVVIGNLGKAQNGREYLAIKGSSTGIPADEVEFLN